MDHSTIFQEYINQGWALVPIEAGLKAPWGEGWNERANCVLPPGYGRQGESVGLAHAFCDPPTCTIDLDQLREAITLLGLRGVDLQAHIDAPDAVWIIGNPDNHHKLLYRMPPGLILPTKHIEVGGRHAIQFRCATAAGLTVQDVLPPSWHPDVNQPYQWGGPGDWRSLPEIPEELLEVWIELCGGYLAVMGLTEPRGAPAAETPEYNDETVSRITSMLAVLNPDMGRNLWYRVGMAIHSVSEDLYGLWDAWSARGDKYEGPGDTGAVWRSFSNPTELAEGEAVTFATLRRLAYQAGWRDIIDTEALYRAAGFTGEHVPGHSVSPDDAPAPEAVTGSADGSAAPVQGFSFDQLYEQAMGLRPLDDVHEILARAVHLTPTEQDRLVTTISDQAGVTRTALRDELRLLMRAARATMLGPGETGEANHPRFALVHPETGRPLDHVDNLRALCAWAGVHIQFNEMTHDIEVLSSQTWSVDDWRNQQLYWIRDQMVRWGMPYARSLEHVKTIALANTYHPFRVMLDRAQWDGVSRWQKVCETIRTTHPGQRDLYLRKWCLSGVAAVRGWERGVPPRGVLVFSGEQAQGKTSWLRYLTPRGLFGEGLHLDPGNKDSLKQAVSWWVVELGELDSTFNKADISRLKAHISKGVDELRLPYAPSESRWPRRTVYAGTVNKPEFLADQTGNTRFWPIETLSFDLDAMRAMWESGEIIQFWKEVESWYQAGEQWWLSGPELRSLEEHNEEFRDRPAVEEVLEYVYLWEAPLDQWRWKTPAEIRQDCEISIRGSGPGLQGSENTQFKEALKRLSGQTKAVRNREGGPQARRWKVPPKRFEVIMGGKEDE